ncbi:DNA gyrase/topoisomerase IV subunit A [Candidatus Sulfidibacterium hydrothermale]|uniref:DNA gyrase/topoisomerase IV subunit A n=1 Tax=Candidatus Sulfidibacterium hydrothermale TaxID=2875962 RepID=UPI001F0A6341|nr:DNA gyrase/topoisomerase IV subunit A [Candidatus Sulfidibacterium hydrothermale]UBM61214.1 DNA gyrase/topoisomerase IV subunit A [Candidatus Sulfidibacterium hydrothermale]
MDELESQNLPREGEEQNNPDKKERKEEYRHLHLSGMYENWFLDYASYVILERAVPEAADGLKPVQRRILHAMSRLDDGRFNKVANIIGHTMQFHPHGDASIGDALVQLGQKELLIDTQGNWGNTLTGDSAAAPRYIEARLSAFAKEVVFNPKTTQWKLSYDGRNKEPVTLPVKFPLLLAQGVEGIAVGLASKILPHNFNELIDASIRYLQGKDFELYPDFLTGGMVDVSKYNEGLRGGKIRVRAKISQRDKKTLVITEIPYYTTTSSLIDSIVAANDKGKIKIKKIDDNTAENVEIVIYLASNVSPDQTIDALYAFTNCEMSISPNACVILDGRPQFISVKQILRANTDRTVSLLKQELEIRLGELEDHWHNASLEKIFIENRIYLLIEKCETWDCVLTTIDKGLEPFKKSLRREVTHDDLVRLTEIKIKRISKYNAFKAEEQIKKVEEEMEEVKNHLAHLIDYTIQYFKQIKKKYGKGRERRTEIRNFDTIQANMVAVANEKLYVNREEGFAGTGLKKDEYVSDCSDIDDIIVFREDGTFLVTKVAPKVFVGKNVIHIAVFKKNDDRTIYNMIYRDGRQGKYYVKRFAVKGVTRDKEYDLTKGTPGSKVVYFSANPNGEAEVVRVNLRPKPKMKKTHFDFDFKDLAIKGRTSQGNILSKTSIRNIVKREEGVSTLGALDVWYDETVRRLNTEERGVHLGAFKGDDKILTILSTGEFKLTGYDLATHFDDEMIFIEKFNPEKTITVVYFDGGQERYYLKRFTIDADTPADRKYSFIPDSKGSRLVLFTLDERPRLEVELKTKNDQELISEIILAEDFIGVKSYRAKGKRISNKEVKKIKWLSPLPVENTPAEEAEEENNGGKTASATEETDKPKTTEAEPVKPADSSKKPVPEEGDKNQKTGDGEDEIQLELF